MYLSLHVKNIHFDIISYDQLQLHGLIRSSNQQIANHLLKVKYHQLEIIVTTSQNSLYKSGQYNFMSMYVIVSNGFQRLIIYARNVNVYTIKAYRLYTKKLNIWNLY